MTISKEQLDRELAVLAHTPMEFSDIERLEIEALYAIMRPLHPYRERAKQILRMTAEIRKYRDKWTGHDLTDREIDAEIADVYNRMG